MKTATFEQLLSRVPEERIENSKEYWADRTLEDVESEMPEAVRYGSADIVIVEPDSPDTDETKTLVLPLEFAQGYTAPHFMRAKVLQQYVAPDSRVVIMPNSSMSREHVDFNSLYKSQVDVLKSGSNYPYVSLLLESLEEASMVHSFGELGLVGSSQAGTSVINMAGLSGKLEIGGVTAIETPSKLHRSSRGLLKDFLLSGGDLGASVKESEIPAQLEAMHGIKLAVDLGKFAVRLFHRESTIIGRSLAGSINSEIKAAASQLGDRPLSLMFVEDSTVFDPDSLDRFAQARVDLVKIVGEYAHGHSTPNNLRFNAAMAYSGLNAREIASPEKSA